MVEMRVCLYLLPVTLDVSGGHLEAQSSSAMSVSAGFCKWTHVMQSWRERAHHALRHLSDATGIGDGTAQGAVERVLCVYRPWAPLMTPIALSLTVKGLLVKVGHHGAVKVAAGQRRSRNVRNNVTLFLTNLCWNNIWSEMFPKWLDLTTKSLCFHKILDLSKQSDFTSVRVICRFIHKGNKINSDSVWVTIKQFPGTCI